MKLVNKNHKSIIVSNYIKKNSLLLLFFTNHRNINDWITIKQNLKSINSNDLGVFKNISQKLLKQSIYIYSNTLSSQTLILLKSKDLLLSFVTKVNFEFFSLYMLAIKLDNKIYHKNQLKNNYCFNYKVNKLLIFQFKVVNLKKKSK